MKFSTRKHSYWNSARRAANNTSTYFGKLISENNWKLAPPDTSPQYGDVICSCWFCHIGLRNSDFWVHMISHYSHAMHYFNEKKLPCTRKRTYNYLLHISLVEGLNGGKDFREDS